MLESLPPVHPSPIIAFASIGMGSRRVLVPRCGNERYFVSYMETLYFVQGDI